MEDDEGVANDGKKAEVGNAPAPAAAERSGVAMAAGVANEAEDDGDGSPLCHSASSTSSEDISVSVGGTISGSGCENSKASTVNEMKIH